MFATLLLLPTLSFLQAAPESALLGPWQAWLDTPGGKLAFELDITAEGDGWHAHVNNGAERVDATRFAVDRDVVTLWFDPYDSKISARLGEPGTVFSPRTVGDWSSHPAERELHGEWVKRSGPQRWTVLPFNARAGEAALGTRSVPELSGRWAVRFEKSDDPAVAIFEPRINARGHDAGISGTVLTTLGDYRYLAGSTSDGSHIELSCFDGAHAFLFKAELKPSGALLEGDFWSGDAWHETWTATRDDTAGLPDSFGLTKWNEKAKLPLVSLPDCDGNKWVLGDFPGKARMLVLFGSWCPNCNDEAEFLRELDAKYRERGLSIVGLAFELTGEFARDAKQVKLYAQHHQLTFPLLIAGTSDKDAASKSFPLLDKIRAYPTTIFLHGDGRVRAVHQGYSGPATGAEHVKLREDFERLIEELLAETGAKK